MAASETSGQHAKSRRRPVTAFTLIELLIIVAIVLAVAACMAPLYFHTKAEAARAKCLDNLRALGHAMLQYCASNDDTLPMAYYPEGAAHSGFATKPAPDSDAITWADLMYPAVPHPSRYTCPADSLRPQGDPKRSLSYALNAYFYVQPGGVHRQVFNGGGLTEVPDVQAKLLLTESTSGVGNELAMPASLPSGVWKRHMGGANWIFGDGHAEYHVPPASWATDNPDSWRDPDQAAKHNYPQWFPWVTGKPRWGS